MWVLSRERLSDIENDLEVSLFNLREPQEEKAKLMVEIKKDRCLKCLKCHLFLMISDARNSRKEGQV
jgi:hypothetical protein